MWLHSLSLFNEKPNHTFSAPSLLGGSDAEHHLQSWKYTHTCTSRAASKPADTNCPETFSSLTTVQRDDLRAILSLRAFMSPLSASYLIAEENAALDVCWSSQLKRQTMDMYETNVQNIYRFDDMRVNMIFPLNTKGQRSPGTKCSHIFLWLSHMWQHSTLKAKHVQKNN